MMRAAMAAFREGIARPLSRVAVACATAAIVFLSGAAPAWAHDPIILTPQQMTPASGPLLLDGTVSFALYGTLEAPGDTRGFRARFKAGDTLTLSALVPDLPPERNLARGDLPAVTVRTPAGEEIRLAPGAITTFEEPFTSTRYRRYLEWSTPATAGDYGVVVSGPVPARFTVSVGTQERFGTPVENVPNRSVGVAGVQEWYRTPPPEAPTTTTATRAPTGAPTTRPTTSGADDDSADTGGLILWLALAVGAVATVVVLVVRAVRRRRSTDAEDALARSTRDGPEGGASD